MGNWDVAKYTPVAFWAGILISGCAGYLIGLWVA